MSHLRQTLLHGTAILGSERRTPPGEVHEHKPTCLLPDLHNPQPTARPQDGQEKHKTLSKTGVESYRRKIIRANKIGPSSADLCYFRTSLQGKVKFKY